MPSKQSKYECLMCHFRITDDAGEYKVCPKCGVKMCETVKGMITKCKNVTRCAYAK